MKVGENLGEMRGRRKDMAESDGERIFGWLKK